MGKLTPYHPMYFMAAQYTFEAVCWWTENFTGLYTDEFRFLVYAGTWSYQEPTIVGDCPWEIS